LPEFFTPEDLWASCFESRSPKLNNSNWMNPFYHAMEEWILKQLPMEFSSDPQKKAQAQTLFSFGMQLLGKSSHDALEIVRTQPLAIDSSNDRYNLKLTIHSWAKKSLRECQNIAARDINRLISIPKKISSAHITHHDGSVVDIELDNTGKMNESEKTAFANGFLDTHPVIGRLQAQLEMLNITEDQMKGVWSALSASGEIILTPISMLFNSRAIAAGHKGLAGEHSSCEIAIKQSNQDVLLSLKPIGLDWLDCTIEYRISPNGDGTVNHYHARANLTQ
jgi:hypothetical protein